MLAARATGASSLRSVRPLAAFAVAAGRAAPRALSAKPPAPSPEEEAERQATQMRALDVVLKAEQQAGERQAAFLGIVEDTLGVWRVASFASCAMCVLVCVWCFVENLV